jgi:hypothetical protein
MGPGHFLETKRQERAGEPPSSADKEINSGAVPPLPIHFTALCLVN